MAGKAHLCQESRTGKKRKKLQPQFVVCQRLCRAMPEVQRVMRRLSSTRKYCNNYEWKRRPFIPPRALKAGGDVGSQHEEKDPVIVNTREDTSSQSKGKENLAQKNRADSDTHNKEGEHVAEKSNINFDAQSKEGEPIAEEDRVYYDTQSKEGEHVAEKSRANSDTQNTEEKPVAEESRVHSNIQSKEVEHVAEKVGDGDSVRNEEESVSRSTSDSDCKFSSSCEVIDIVTNLESKRRKRVMDLLGRLDLDYSTILKPTQDPKEQDVLLPYIIESSGADQSGKAAAAATCKNQCSSTSQPQKLKKCKTSHRDVSKDTQKKMNTAEPQNVKRCKITKKHISGNIPENSNITGQRKLKRSKASDKEVSGHVEGKSGIAGPERIKRRKTTSFYVSEHNKGKPISAEPQKQEKELESHENINEDVSKNIQGKSNIAGQRKLWRLQANDKDVPKHIQTPKPQPGAKKRGRKSKAEKARLLLEQMVQCCNMLQSSSSHSHRHIAQLLSMEIKKAKEGEVTPTPSEASHGHGVSAKPGETADPRVDDSQVDSPIQEDFESQVLEIEATFLVKASARGQEIKGVSLPPPTLQYSGAEAKVSGRAEESSTSEGLSETFENSSELLPPILRPQCAQFKPYSSFSSRIFSDDSLSPDTHDTTSKLVSSVSRSIPSDPNHTQSEPVHPHLHYTPPVCIQSESHPSVKNIHTALPCMMPNLMQGLSYTADSHTEPQHSSPSHSTQQETSPSIIPHSTESELNACPPNNTGTKLHISTSQDNPPEDHSSVLDHTQADPHVGVEGNQEQPQFSSPHHTQLGSFSIMLHHTQTEPLSSQSGPCYPVCSSPKKKTQKSSQKSTCNYNLRSKLHNKGNVSETVTPTEFSNMTTLLKKHCKSEPRVYLRKVECDTSIVVIKNAESQKLSAPTARDMSLPVSIPVSMLALPSGQKNVVQVLEKVVDSQEGKCVKGKLQEGSSKSACMKNDSEEGMHVSNIHRSTNDDSAVSVVGAESSLGDAENSVKETDCEESQGGIVEVSFFDETCHESSEKELSVMQEGTDVEHSQREIAEESLLGETCGERSQNTETSEISQEETDVESLGGTFDGNVSEETSGKNSHKTEGSEMSQDRNDAKNSQGGNFSDEMCVEKCQEVETSEMSQEGTDGEASANSQGESDTEGHQKVVQRVENRQEVSCAEECQALAVSASDSQGGTSGEQYETVVESDVNSEGGPEIEECQMVVNAANNQEGTGGKGSQLVVVSGAGSQERKGVEGQVYEEGINISTSSLYSDGNGYFDFHNITLAPDQRSKLTRCDFDTKRSNLYKTSVSDHDCVRGSGRAALGNDSCSGITEQSDTLEVDEGKCISLAEDEQCPPTSHEPSLCQSECDTAAAGLYDAICSQTGEDSISTEFVHHLPNEAQLLENLERRLENTGRDWGVQSNFEAQNVILKDTTMGKTSPAQASSEEQVELRQCSESPAAPASAPHCEGHDTHTDETSLTEEGKDGEAAGNGDPIDSDGEDVLSLYTDYSLLDTDVSGEEDTPEADDFKIFKDTEEDHTEEYSSVSKSEGMAGDVKDSMLAEPSEHSQSGDGLEVGAGSDEALSPTDSDVESLQSKSSVIDRIVENEAKCSLEEEMLESGILNSFPSGDKGGQSNEAEGPAEVFRDGQEVITASPLSSPPEVLQSDSTSRECTDPIDASNNAGSPHCFKPSQSEWNFIPLQENKPGETGFRGQEEVCDKTTSDKSPFTSCKSNERAQPPTATQALVVPPPSLYRNRTFLVPRPKLPGNLGICFLFINRGFCERQDCHYSHEITLECESYLGLLILHFVTNNRQHDAWTLLKHHLSHHHNSLPLAVSFLLPLARYLVNLTHNKQPSWIRVPSSLTLPLDIAKMRILCVGRHGATAFRLLSSCYTRASPEGLKILLNIFVRFCESFPGRELLSPWEKVVLWGYDCHEGSSTDKLKDLLSIEWLRLQMLSGNASKVLKVYNHLSQALTSPNVFFTRITCQVISYFIDTGKLQDSFKVLGQVRRLRAKSCSILTALIPTNRESVQALVAELQELGELVCELCVPLAASSWSLLLSHMMDIHDLPMTMNLLLVQMNFMTPEINILKWLLKEGITKGPAILQPLCSFVCQLPEKVLRPLENSLSCLINACTPSSQHMKSQIIQHCKRFGINLRPLFDDSAILIEEHIEPYQCNSSFIQKENSSSITNNNSIGIHSNSDSTISDYLSSNSSSSCSQGELQNHTPPPGFVVFHQEMSTSETSGLVENIVADRGCAQDLRGDYVPTLCGQSELPMSPSPRSLSHSVRSELVSSHCLEDVKLVTKLGPQEECAVAQKVQQHQPLTIDYNHQMPAREFPCNLRTQNKAFTVTRGKNCSHDLGSSLMSPDSTNISPIISHTKTDSKEKSPANSKVMRKLAKSSGSCGFHSAQSHHSHSQKTYSKSSCKDSGGFNEMVSKTHTKFGPLKNSSIPQKPEEIPRFYIIKRDNFILPKISCNQDLREREVSNLEDLGMNHLPPGDEASSSGVEVNHDRVAPLKFPQVAEKVLKIFSHTSAPVQNLQVSSQQDERRLSHQRPITSCQVHQVFEKDINSEKFSGWPGRLFNMQQKHWFLLEKDGQLDHMRSSSTLGSSPSSSGFSDPYVCSSPPSRPSSRVSREKGCSEQQLAVKALWVLYHMKNYSLFIDILEETSWSGGVEDVRARLQLLCEVLDVMRQSGKSKVSLWYTGKILASLVIYYYSDTMMLHNYHDLLDLPGHLEAAWECVEALGIVGVVEQFIVILKTALRLGLPFSQHFTYHLMNRGIGVGSMEMVMAPDRSYGKLPLPLTVQRECASQKWNGKPRQGKAPRRGSKRRGAFQGTYKGGRLHGHPRGRQAALDRQQN
ncbi:uncharacterized protein LOC135111501 isoform X2 [Scylla paramamosain]|uniref:uncharacterized protein LOC135111501 isoform X2 n=1 Tax=Scylla paramamosain TaxID=85552 RepID=UPI003083BA19